jgi:hypothetical protein
MEAQAETAAIGVATAAPAVLEAQAAEMGATVSREERAEERATVAAAESSCLLCCRRQPQTRW